MNVVICGSRVWWDGSAIARRIRALPRDALVITGGAEGADKYADDFARYFGYDRLIVPANWTRYGKAAGPVRNQRMLDMLTPNTDDLLLAFRCDGVSRGTDDMIRRARKCGVKVEVISGLIPVS
jgi:hypothetical protein